MNKSNRANPAGANELSWGGPWPVSPEPSSLPALPGLSAPKVFTFLAFSKVRMKGTLPRKVKALNKLFCECKVHLQLLVMFKYLKYEVTRCCFTTHPPTQACFSSIFPLNCADITFPSSTLQPFPASLLFSDYSFSPFLLSLQLRFLIRHSQTASPAQILPLAPFLFSPVG